MLQCLVHGHRQDVIQSYIVGVYMVQFIYNFSANIFFENLSVFICINCTQHRDFYLLKGFLNPVKNDVHSVLVPNMNTVIL